MTDSPEERPQPAPFDPQRYAEDSLFYERREGQDRREIVPRPTPPTEPTKAEAPNRPAPERRAKKERRRRIDPTTFEKQYTDDELEFMNAMQCFKVQSGKAFPSFGDVLKVAYGLGYRKVIASSGDSAEAEIEHEPEPGIAREPTDSFELIRAFAGE